MQGVRERGMKSFSSSHHGRERVLKGEKAGWMGDVSCVCKSGIFLSTLLLFGLLCEG